MLVCVVVCVCEFATSCSSLPPCTIMPWTLSGRAFVCNCRLAHVTFMTGVRFLNPTPRFDECRAIWLLLTARMLSIWMFCALMAMVFPSHALSHGKIRIALDECWAMLLILPYTLFWQGAKRGLPGTDHSK